MSAISEKDKKFEKLPDLTSEPRFRVRIFSNEQVAPEVILLSLGRPKDFTFVPGQYLWLVVPERSKKQGVVDRRAYSISSATQNKNLELLIRLTNSDYLKDVASLKDGDEIDIIGPMGSTFIPPETGAILIAGGTGVAPFLSILRSGVSGEFSLLAFASKERPLHCKTELEGLASTRGHIVRYKEDTPKKGDLADVVSKSDRPVFIAGPQGFVDIITDLLAELDISPKRMRYEALYPLLGTSGEVVTSLQKLVDQSYDLISKPQAMPELSGLGDLFLMAIKQTTNHITITDPDGRILFVNKAAEETTGYSLEEMRGQTPRLWGGLMPPLLYQTLWEEKGTGEKHFYVVLNRRRDGRLYVARARISPIMIKGIPVAYVATEEDITDLLELDKAKSDFISIASHQLRTPLTGIEWTAERFEEKEKMSKIGHEYIKNILTSAKSLSTLVDSLLNVTRIEGSGGIAVVPETFDLVALIKNFMEEMHMLCDKKKINQVFVGHPKSLEIVSDKNIVRNIVQSLISNAVEYTPDGGKVETFVEQRDQTIVLTVRDTGIGISKESQKKLFTKFYRAENAKRVKAGGTGLGLFIVKSGIDLLGGTVSVESAEGKGATFRVELPVESKAQKGNKRLQG